MKYIAIEPISVGICTGCIFYNNGHCANPNSLIWDCCPNHKHTYIFTLINIKLPINVKVL